MSNEMHHCYPSATLMDVLEAERTLGIPLPEQYRKHLLRYNGGIPAKGAFQYINKNGEDNSDTIGRFCSLSINGPSDLCAMRAQNWMLPPELLEIAYTGVGNMILIGLTGDIRGKIFFFDKEFWYDKEGVDPWDPILPLADGFDQLMTEVLFQYPEDDEP